ncbi:MAG: DUF2784 domain-containing protein [Burkholderiales bacterium]
MFADALVIVHAGIVVFVVGGLPFIWLGAWRRWPAIRNFRFRVVHLGTIVFVALESLLGITCPLTLWEHALRERDVGHGFIAHWVNEFLYYDLPGWVFLCAYLLFALAVAATFLLIPPESGRRNTE